MAMTTKLGKNVLSNRDDEEAEEERCNNFLSLIHLNLPPIKKLLILDLNGFLLRRVFRYDTSNVPRNRPVDATYGNYNVYKRPFSDQFIKFCFERFDVGIWSSAKEKNVDGVLSCAMGKMRDKLLFVLDQKECTDSGFTSLEKKGKPIFLKEVGKVLMKVRGNHSASNTLLIDDSPYKALLNLPYTGIFPEPYDANDVHDKALDPEGELGWYLDGLADAENVESYVKAHPFGRKPITASHPHWGFYSLIIRRLSPNKSSPNK